MLGPLWALFGQGLSFLCQKLTLFCYLRPKLDTGGKSCYPGAYVSTVKPYKVGTLYQKGGGLVLYT